MAQNKQYTIEALKRSTEFEGYKNLLSALFNSQDKATKEEVRQAIQEYLDREVD